MPGYLEELTIRLATGIGRLTDAERDRHAAYLRGMQQADGGFAGRAEGSDLYYTSFALRSLAILGELTGSTAERAVGFLRGRLSGRESIVDFFSLIYGAALLDSAAGIDPLEDAAPDWRQKVAEALEALRRPDGGYAKGDAGAASSTYHTFLVLLCRELIGQPVSDPGRVLEFLMGQRCAEGGFREIRASKRAGTNPTAAAIAALRILNELPDDVRGESLEFLREMRTDEGGLRANTRIPIADLLSTFTGTLTLLDLGDRHLVTDPDAKREMLAYVRSLEHPHGGFQGAAWDVACDVEYTFYGLGTLALLT